MDLPRVFDVPNSTMRYPFPLHRHQRTFLACATLVAAMFTASLLGQDPTKRWWLDEPVRLFQTNVQETSSTLDAKRFIAQISDFSANTLLFNMGGIVAQYPTKIPFHYVSEYMPPGRDLFREILEEAHARQIRVIGRFDLSKAQKPVFDAHPEWFFKRVTGGPALYNGTYLACINGDYYHVHGLKILTEALESYDVDGLFFNMFGNPGEDYSGIPIGPCQCGACQQRFQTRYGRPLPTHWDDPDYRDFMAASTRATATKIADLIHRVRPGTAFLTYLEEFTDVIMDESDASVSRPLPLWPYMSSDNVNRLRTSEPGKPVFNMSMSSVDYPWRFVTVPQGEVQLRLYQNIAHGGALAFSVVGTPDQEDRRAMIAAKPIFQWHAKERPKRSGFNV